MVDVGFDAGRNNDKIQGIETAQNAIMQKV
jgi:hypothetical protein